MLEACAVLLPLRMVLLKFGGQGDQHLVILHATGFLSAAYQPLAAALSKSFVVWGLDLPGHGAAAAAGRPQPDDLSAITTSNSPTTSSSSVASMSLPSLTQYVVDTIQQAGLSGCCAFGHSAGGALALLAASRCPQLFRALYCFEAVVSAPASHSFMAAASGRGDIVTDGQLLGAMARKRRAAFPSRQAALQHLAAKPPFSRMDPRVVQLYVQHGFTEQQQQHCEHADERAQQQPLGVQQAMHQQNRLQPPTTAAMQGPETAHQWLQPTQQQQQQHPRQQHGGGACGDSTEQQAVQLVCCPQQEGAMYDALQPPPAIDPTSISCPVMLAVAAPHQAGSSSDSAAQLATHQAVQAWFYQHQAATRDRRSSSGPLHGALRVLNIELAAAMPTAQLLEVEGVSHFGPLEKPEQLAASAEAFFTQCGEGLVVAPGNSSSSSSREVWHGRSRL